MRGKPALAARDTGQKERSAALIWRSRALHQRHKELLDHAGKLANGVLTICREMGRRQRPLKRARRSFVATECPKLAPDEIIERLIDALQDAVAVLSAEFSDVPGSGQETLLKCERALRDAGVRRSVVILRL